MATKYRHMQRGNDRGNYVWSIFVCVGPAACSVLVNKTVIDWLCMFYVYDAKPRLKQAYRITGTLFTKTLIWIFHESN